MGSDSRFIDVIGYEELLDLSEPEWQYEKLPIEEVQLLSTTVLNSLLTTNSSNINPHIDLPLFFEGDNNEDDLEDMTLAERERKEWEWNDNGDGLYIDDTDSLLTTDFLTLPSNGTSGTTVNNNHNNPSIYSNNQSDIGQEDYEDDNEE